MADYYISRWVRTVVAAGAGQTTFVANSNRLAMYVAVPGTGAAIAFDPSGGTLASINDALPVAPGSFIFFDPGEAPVKASTIYSVGAQNVVIVEGFA